MTRWMVVALVGLVSTDALALDPYMWGVGPKIGTMVLPGQYPVRFPQAVRNDANADLSRVKNDLSLGVDAVYYINGRSRARSFASLGFGLGEPYFDANWNVGYQFVAVTGAMDVLFGGAAGVGTATFHGTELARLQMPYYPLRADASALIRDETRGYQATAYFVYNVPGKQTFTGSDGVDLTVGWGVNFALGIEFALYFGDLMPPRPRSKGATES